MHRVVLVLVLLPVALSAQESGRWALEAATGVSIADNGSATQSVGPALSLALDRGLSRRVAFRGAADWGSFRPHDLDCTPTPPTTVCTSGVGVAMTGLSVGIVAARSQLDRGLYLSTRAGLYVLGSQSGMQPGGYVGVGVAAPTTFGAVTFEIGVHGYAAESQPSWNVPVRVGLRWRP